VWALYIASVSVYLMQPGSTSWAAPGERASQCVRRLSLKVSSLKVSQGSDPQAEVSLEDARLSPCEGLEGWVELRGRRVTLDDRWLRLEEPELRLAGRLAVPLPTLTLDRGQPWRWLRLPKAGWSEGSPWVSVPLSIPIGERSLSPSVGWWRGPTAGFGLTLDEGSAELMWSARRGGALIAQLNRVADQAGGLNLWLLGRWASRPLSVAPRGGLSWAERALRRREELWGGGSASLTPGVELRWLNLQLTPLLGVNVSVSYARLSWSLPSEDQRVQRSLGGVLRRGERLGRRVTLAGRYERQRWLRALRLRAVARAEGQLMSEGDDPTLSKGGWLWLTFGTGTRGEGYNLGVLSALDLELRAELVTSALYSALRSEPLALAPSWGQLERRAPRLGRVGLSLEWERRAIRRRSTQSDVTGLKWSIWSGVAQSALSPQRHHMISPPAWLSVTTLSGSWAPLGVDAHLDLEAGFTRDTAEGQEWSAGELRVGARWWGSGRAILGVAPLGGWGMTLVSPTRVEGSGVRPDQRARSESARSGVAVGHRGAQLSLTLSAWSARVVALDARWEGMCSCWGLRGAVGWSEELGAQLSLSLDLGRGG